MTGTGRRLLLAIGGAFALTSVVAVHPPSDTESVPATFTCQGILAIPDRGHIVECPFVAPADTKQVDVDVTFDRVARPIQLDLGLRSPRGLRGWSEDRHDHLHIDEESASYGYTPGPIERGLWAVLIGVANITEPGVRYRVNIRLSNTLDRPRRVLNPYEGWYAGDLHAHSGHSDGYHVRADGTRQPVTVSEIESAARRAGLDFIAVTDHNTTSQWLDVDRLQPSADNVLLLHGQEVTTYRGHFNAIAERRAFEFPGESGDPLFQLLRQAAADGSFVSINHPSLPDDDSCRGCRWAPIDDATIGHANGVEVLNGPLEGDDLPDWRFWARLLNAGYRLVGVGGSDAHDPDWAEHPVGRPTTVVHAFELSEDGILDGLMRGRVYVRTAGADGPSIDLLATGPRESVAMGGSVPAGHVTLELDVRGARGQECMWIERGETIRSTTIAADASRLTLDVDAVAGDWFSVILTRAGHPTLLSNAIYVNR